MTILANEPSAFAARLRALRERVGYTQAEVATAVGVGYQTYLRWERGTHEPEYSQLIKLAEMFGVTLNDFHTDDDT